MRLGFEDWDFWIQSAAAGFEGRHLPKAGFMYRRRAESMLVESERYRVAIQVYMRRKHDRLLRPRALLAREHAELPLYAFFLGDRGQVLFGTDPSTAAAMPATSARRALARAAASRGRAPFPPFAAFGSSAALERLADGRLLRAVLWEAERLLAADHHVVGVAIETGPPPSTVSSRPTRRRPAARSAALPLLLTSWSLVEACVRDQDDGWIRAVLAGSTGEVALLRARTPGPDEGRERSRCWRPAATCWPSSALPGRSAAATRGAARPGAATPGSGRPNPTSSPASWRSAGRSTRSSPRRPARR
jgi:hypothetical protein